MGNAALFLSPLSFLQPCSWVPWLLLWSSFLENFCIFASHLATPCKCFLYACVRVWTRRSMCHRHPVFCSDGNSSELSKWGRQSPVCMHWVPVLFLWVLLGWLWIWCLPGNDIITELCSKLLLFKASTTACVLSCLLVLSECEEKQTFEKVLQPNSVCNAMGRRLTKIIAVREI